MQGHLTIFEKLECIHRAGMEWLAGTFRAGFVSLMSCEVVLGGGERILERLSSDMTFCQKGVGET